MTDNDRSYDTSRPDWPSEHGGKTDDAGQIGSRQRLRLRRASIAAAIYVLIGVYTLYLYVSGQLAFDPMTLIGMNLAILAGNCVYFWLIASGCNLQFLDPSLTWPHVTLAAGFTLFGRIGLEADIVRGQGDHAVI